MTLFASPAAAQVLPPAASQVTPRDLRPQQETTDAPTTVAPRTGAAPAGSETLSFTPARVTVVGGYPFLQQQTDAIFADYIDRPMTVADFYKLGDRLQRLYTGEGYPLARILVPAQSLRNGGEAHFELIDGQVSDIDVEGVPRGLREAVRRILAPLIGHGRLRNAEIERRLLLAGQIPGASLRSALAPGKQPGTTKLVIESGYQVIGGGSNFDDLAGAAFNRRNFSIHAAANGIFRQGEQLYMFASSDPLDYDAPFSRNSPRSVIGGGLSVPIGHNGLQLNLEGTRSRTQPLGGFFITHDNFDRASLRLSYPLVLDRRVSLTVQASVEGLREVQVLPQFDDFVLSKDRFIISRLGWQFSVTQGRVAFSSGLTFSYGRGLPSDIAPYSRGAATDRFTRVEGDISASIQLPLHFNVVNDLRMAAVTSGGLPNAELFQLDGSNALSTFTSGALSADEGATARISLNRPIPVTSTWAVAPYAFAAGGVARNTIPTIFDTRKAAAYGVGVSTDLRFPRIHSGISATVEYGRGETDNPFFPDENRCSIKLGLRF